ncbi:MAG TPA: OmpH family outer membrane protein [Candidatus Angelobacter sp.]|nr:OmpH family outer membrane protein [Candidatus Angelobacter sp.]
MLVKSRIHACLLGLVLGSLPSLPALAQSSASAPAVAGPKVAIVNVEEAISTCNEGKKELDALQQKYAPKETTFNKELNDLNNLKKQLETDAPKLNPEERNKRAKDIELKERNLQRSFDDTRNEFQQEKLEVGNRIYQKMSRIMEKLAQQRGYDMILDVSTQQNPVLVFHPSLVITKDLVNAFNAESPAAPKTAAAGPAKPAAARTGTAAKKP